MSHPRRRSQAVGVPLVESLDGGRHELRLDPKQPRQSLGEDGEGAMGGGTRGVGVRAHATSKGVAGGRRGERASDVRGGAVAAADEPQSRLHGGVGIGRVRGSRPRADVGGDGGRDEVELAGVDPHAIGDRLGLDPLGEVEGALDEEKLAVVVPDARGEGGERAGQLDEQPDDEPLILHVVAERGGAGEVRGEAARAPGGRDDLELKGIALPDVPVEVRLEVRHAGSAARLQRLGDGSLVGGVGARIGKDAEELVPRAVGLDARGSAGRHRGAEERRHRALHPNAGHRKTRAFPAAGQSRATTIQGQEAIRRAGKVFRSRRAFLHPSISDGSKLASVRAGVG